MANLGLKSITLMLLAILILVIPGMLYNNLNNNGLVVAQSQSLSCAATINGLPQDPTCQISGNVGCQSSSNYCTLSGRSISFLSSTSIFTSLISGNIFALFNPVQTGSLGHRPFDSSPGYPVILANCAFTVIGQREQTTNAPGNCTEMNPDHSNKTFGQTTAWTNWNTNYNTSLSLHFFSLGNATFASSCTWLTQINFTLLANGPGFTYYGCRIRQGASTNPAVVRMWGYLVAMNVEQGPLPAGYSHRYVVVQLTGWDAQGCNGSTSVYSSIPCETWHSQFKGTPLYTSGNSIVNFQPSGGLALLGFFGGIILLVLGLGLGFTSSALGIQDNEQGTKLFQTLGFGLVVWSPLYSEFSTWFTSGYLPYGLDGTVGVTALLLTGMFFFGVVWRIMSRD